MPLYTFFLHDGPDTITRFELELFDSLEAAVDHGETLLAQRPHYTDVTIADGDVEIARVRRREDQSTPT